MRKKNIHSIVFILFLSNLVYGQRVEFFLYPTNSFDDIRYSIIVDRGMIMIENHDTLIGTKIPHSASIKKISDNQLKKLKALVIETKFMKEESVLVIQGTWGCKLVVNNITLLESTCFTYESRACS